MAATSSASSDKIVLASIQPFRSSCSKAGPIEKVPKYLFENSNYSQTNTSYVSAYLSILRERVREIKLSEILKVEDSKKVKIAKEFDWVFALDKLETDYLTKSEMLLTALKVEDIVQINKCLSRFTYSSELRKEEDIDDLPGDFRKEKLRSSIHNMTIIETVAFGIIEKEVSKTVLFSSFSDSLILLTPMIRNKSWLSTLLIGLRQLQSNTTIYSTCSFKSIKDAVNSWADAHDKIDLIKWLKDRMHYFPEPSKIEAELQKSIDSIKDSKMHPIEKAAKIYFDIAKIHVFNAANMETARFMGYAILLSHGYLPPIIGNEEYEEYLACIHQGAEKGEGHIPLTNFLAKQILNTQNKFKSDSRAISELS